MTNLVSAFQKKDIVEFEHILKGKLYVHRKGEYIPIHPTPTSQSNINYG